MSRIAIVVAMALALLLSGCGVHGTTSIWNELHHISQQLNQIDRDLKAARR